MNANHTFLLLAIIAPSQAFAQLDNCALVDKIAAISYGQANEALKRNWTEAARSAAFFFWTVHDLGDCPLSKEMGGYMTTNGLVRGTEPTGPVGITSKFQASLALPSTTKFAQVAGNYAKAVIAPQTIVVNGLTYRLQGAMPNGVFTQQAIDVFLKDVNKSDIGGVTADRGVLKQWADVPVIPSVFK